MGDQRRRRFEELDWRPTPLGEISLRRRWDPSVEQDVYEVKLGEEFLMSSLFTAAEEELARIALAQVAGEDLDVVVGGLGLGYTARTVLESARVGSLLVVEALGEVVEWHRQGLVPVGPALTADPRCRLSQGDFFARAADAAGFDLEQPGRRFDAVLVDIDHSPRHLLNPAHAPFYEPDGVRRLTEHLRPGGVYALWSNDPPDEAYLDVLGTQLQDVEARVVRFPNPLQGGESANTVYTGRVPT